MTEPIGRRIFLAHLELSYRLGRKVTLAEFGAMIAAHLERSTPFTAAAISRWESGIQIPTPQVIEAIAAVTHTDPGWISHGTKTAAPAPMGISTTQTGAKPLEVNVGAPKQASAEPVRLQASTERTARARRRR